MQITPVQLLAGKSGLEAQSFFNRLQTGDLLNALVESINRHGQVQLKIGNQRIIAESASPGTLKPGEPLRLIVVENREKVILQIVDREGTKTDKPLVQQLLRNSLPHQEPPQRLLERLSSLIRRTPDAPAGDKMLPQRLFKQIERFIATLPDKAQLSSAPTLKQAVHNSGLFLESRLAALLQRVPASLSQDAATAGQRLTAALSKSLSVRTESPLPGTTPSKELSATLQQPGTALQSSGSRAGLKGIEQDFKAELLRLLVVLDQELPEPDRISQRANPDKNVEPDVRTKASAHSPTAADQGDERYPDAKILRKEVEAAIARIHYNQANALMVDQSRTPVWMIDLPFRDEQQSHLAQLSISYEDDPAQSDPQNRKWQINLTLEIELLGKIHVRLLMSGEQLSSSLWADNSSTYELLRENLQQLSARLERTGFKVESINCFPGPIKAASRLLHPGTDSLVSIKI